MPRTRRPDLRLDRPMQTLLASLAEARAAALSAIDRAERYELSAIAMLHWQGLRVATIADLLDLQEERVTRSIAQLEAEGRA